MHKGVIMLAKAEDKDEALEIVKDFLEGYGDGDVWDWYAVGGRWSNTLAPKKPHDEWKEKAKNLLDPDGTKKGWISTDDVEKNQKTLQDMWKDLGLKGNNPYFDHYKLGDEGDYYDIVPLSECIDVVKEWVRDLEKVADEEFDELVKARTEAKEKKAAGEKHWDMSAYHAGHYKDAIYNNFCFDSCVYDITKEVGESIPENTDGYWAVMIDLHN